jgi:hypothetical protein
MKRSRKDYIGERFGRLVAIAESDPKIRKDRNSPIRRLRCACDCGRVTIVTVPDLRSGNTISCGCYKPEAARVANSTHAPVNFSFARWPGYA